jgi:hypothetical protein
VESGFAVIYELTFGLTGQAITRRCVAGRPAVALFAVYADNTSDDAVALLAGTAAIDTATTTLTASAGYTQANPRLLTVASTVGFVVGRKYLIDNSEWCEPVAIPSATTMVLRHALGGDYSSGDAVVSTYVSAVIDDVFTADTQRLSDVDNPWPDFRVKWTLDGRTEYDGLDLLRTVASYSIDIHELNNRLPGIRDRLPVDFRHDAGKGMISSAWRALQADLTEISTTGSTQANAEILDEALILKIKLMLASGGWAPAGVEWQQFYDVAKAEYDRMFEKHFKLAKPHPVTAADGTSATARRVPVWNK